LGEEGGAFKAGDCWLQQQEEGFVPALSTGTADFRAAATTPPPRLRVHDVINTYLDGELVNGRLALLDARLIELSSVQGVGGEW